MKRELAVQISCGTCLAVTTSS